MTYEVEKDWITRSGLRAVCLVLVRSKRKYHRCGYVEIPKGHVLYGIDYGEPCAAIPPEAAASATLGKKSPILALTCAVDAGADDKVRRSCDIVFDCHGGLTFAGGDGKYPVGSNGWWFGFDCGHAGDGEIEPDYKYHSGLTGVVRSLEYVEAECESLAAQIVAMFPISKAA